MWIGFIDAATGKRSSAVLSFATTEARDVVRAALCAPPSLVGTAADTEDTAEEPGSLS
jgi:hypothetical protein